MPTKPGTALKADYLIVGAGAVGMAFADVLLSETDATIIILDRRAKPGGHWNEAYPFVTLHQPSAFYGVSSVELSKDRKDQTGLNQGLGDLASGAEVCAYFDEVMRHTFLPSGRVQFFPMCNYTGDNSFQSRVTGETYTVEAGKTVDATWLNTTIPSTHTPNFDIEDGVQFMPLNNLTKIETPPQGFTIIGGGKTGIDACLWLLEMGVDPDTIRWIMPRDGWFIDRANTQTGHEFFNNTMGAQANQFEAIAASSSVTDMFDRLESAGYFLRLDPDVRPQMFHGATISKAELTALRQVKNIIRMGRVSKIEKNRIVLEQGEIETSPNIIHIDCSASAIMNHEIIPIFQGNLITPQMVRSYQPVFSAAFVAHIEATRETDKDKNRLCGVVPLPDRDADYIRFTTAFMMNQYNWGQDPELREWLRNNRLDGFSKLASSIPPEDTEKRAIMDRLKTASMPAMMKLQAYMAKLNKGEIS
ncbi:MAG: NAD(P)-binding protein [Pikeienuella sp.]